MEIPTDINLNPGAPNGADVKIAELAEKAKIAEKESVSLMEPGAKRTRGRPKGSVKSPQNMPKTDSPITNQAQPSGVSGSPAGQIASSRLAEPFVRLLSKGGAAYAGDSRAEMSPQELHDVADALGLVLDKWMPLLSKDYGAEVLLVTAISSYGIRVVAIKKSIDAEKKAREEFQKQAGKPVDLKKPISDQLFIPTGMSLEPV